MARTNLRKRLIGRAMYVVAFAMPATNIPQIKQLYSTQQTAGLSLQTWIMFLLVGTIPLMYALTYKIKPLVISNALWTIVEVVMIYGILRFGMLSGPDNLARLTAINTIAKSMTVLGLLCISTALVLLSENILKEPSHAATKK